MTDWPVPEGWQIKALGELLTSSSDLTYGVVQPGSECVDGVPIVRVKDIRGGRIATDEPLRISPDIEKQYQRSRIEGGELLVTLVGTVGETAVAPNELRGWNTARAVATVRLPTADDSEWVGYCLQTPEGKNRIGSRVNTTVQTTLNLKDLREFPVVLPPIAERRAIAEVLGALDDKIESNRRLVDILRQNAKVVAENACSNGERRRLDDIAVFQRGFGYKSSGFAEGGRPMISMGCSERRGWLRRDKVRTYGDAVKEKYFVRAEQLLIVNVDLTWKLDVLGWPLLVPPDLNEAIISNDIFGVQFAEGDEWLSWVVWAELQTWSARSVIEGGAKGTTVASVGIDTLGQVEIRIPDSAIGRSTAETMSAFLRRAWTAEEESVQLTTLRDALLPELLSGRLRLRDALTAVEGAV